MNIREKYNTQETLTTFTIYPKKPSVQLSWWFLVGIIVGAFVLFFLDDIIDEVLRYAIYILMGYFTLHSLYDIYLGSKIKYTFDSKNNAVIRIGPFSSGKKIMKLDEATIFVNSEMGSWYYALGAKKSQFVKNYRISENFSSGKKSDDRQAAYDDYVLGKIYKLIENCLFVK